MIHLCLVWQGQRAPSWLQLSGHHCPPLCHFTIATATSPTRSPCPSPRPSQPASLLQSVQTLIGLGQVRAGHFNHGKSQELIIPSVCLYMCVCLCECVFLCVCVYVCVCDYRMSWFQTWHMPQHIDQDSGPFTKGLERYPL